MQIKKKVEYEAVEGYICDVCGKTITNYEKGDVVSLDTIGGYDSVWGDGNRAELDICGDCFKEKLGEYVRITEPTWPKEVS